MVHRQRARRVACTESIRTAFHRPPAPLPPPLISRTSTSSRFGKADLAHRLFSRRSSAKERSIFAATHLAKHMLKKPSKYLSAEVNVVPMTTFYRIISNDH